MGLRGLRDPSTRPFMCIYSPDLVYSVRVRYFLLLWSLTEASTFMATAHAVARGRRQIRRDPFLRGASPSAPLADSVIGSPRWRHFAATFLLR